VREGQQRKQMTNAQSARFMKANYRRLRLSVTRVGDEGSERARMNAW
jgi:hypothetical protein